MASQTQVIDAQFHHPAQALARTGFTAFWLFSLAHLFIDLYASALSTFQPVLGEKYGLNLTQAGILGGLLVFSSSVMQPAYGVLSDRFQTRMFSALAPAMAGLFISSLGLAPSYGWMIAMVMLSGVGVASFHPQATARATLGLPGNRGRWMAIFISSGTLGLAIGPTYFSTFLTHLGLSRTWWAAIPGVAMTVLLLSGPDSTPPAHARHKFDLAPLKAVWKPLTVLYFLVVIRSIVQVVYTQFLPLYLHRERGFSLTSASLTLTLYLACGAIGGFAGGNLADRFGGRRVIMISMAGCVPFIALFFLGTGPWSLLGLAISGLMLLFTLPVNVVMAQELAPSQSGTVSALMMGFAWGMAGLIFIPLTGWAADHFTLRYSLAALGLFPVIGFVLSCKLPR